MREYVYLAGDFDHDGDVVKQIQKWNKDPNKDLKFKDAHEITQARDESLNCSIKESLLRRMNLIPLLLWLEITLKWCEPDRVLIA